MLQALTTEMKKQGEANRTANAWKLQRMLEWRRGGDESMGRAPRIGSGSGAAQLRQHVAGLQKSVGNQAVLRMLWGHGRPQSATLSDASPVAQHRCACDGARDATGICPECTGESKRTPRDPTLCPSGAEGPPAIPRVLRSGDRFGRPVNRRRTCLDAYGCEWCDESTGVPETSVDHEYCAGNCVAQHEATHASDDASCCKSFGYCMINAPIGQNRCRDAYGTYQTDNSDWTECNAYNIEGQCLNAILSKQCIGGGGGLDEGCCAELQNQMNFVTQKIGEHCPKAVQMPCPFGEDGSLLP
jgi:hypothetical protein